jgi:hypothetical protein
MCSPKQQQQQQQVHLAYGRQASAEMSVAWASNFSEPLAVSYLSTAGLSGTEVAFYHANGLQGTGDTVQVIVAVRLEKDDTVQVAVRLNSNSAGRRLKDFVETLVDRTGEFCLLLNAFQN